MLLCPLCCAEILATFSEKKRQPLITAVHSSVIFTPASRLQPHTQTELKMCRIMPRCDNSVRVHFIIPSSALRSFLSLKWDGSTVIQAWSSGIHLTITSLFPLYFFFSHNVDIVIGNPTCWGGTSVVLNTHANRTAALQLNCVCQQIWLEHQQDYIWRWKVESGFSRWKMSSYLLFSSFTLHLDRSRWILSDAFPPSWGNFVHWPLHTQSSTVYNSKDQRYFCTCIVVVHRKGQDFNIQFRSAG